MSDQKTSNEAKNVEKSEPSRVGFSVLLGDPVRDVEVRTIDLCCEPADGFLETVVRLSHECEKLSMTPISYEPMVFRAILEGCPKSSQVG